jgi:rod shape-determining protein MreC
MENFFSRYKNPLVLMIVLFIQVVGLATQVKRVESARPAGGGGGPRLIRVWTVTIITPFEKAFSGTGRFIRRTWHNYIDLHDARKENQELQAQLVRLKMEKASLQEDAERSRRLQVLLDFKEHYIGQLMPAQVIGTSGADQSRLLYIDKGSRAGIKQDMPVITPDGIVGKVKEVFPFTAQVLMVNDHDSGAGVLMQDSRLHGILSGTPQGQLVVTRVMSDNKVEPGVHVVTSGGDRIYPKGFPVGTVVSSTPDPENDPYLKIIIKPAANLEKLEEVLVVTKVAETAPPATEGTAPQRAADILAQRLPSAKQEVSPTPTPTPAAVVSPAGEKKAPASTGTPAGQKKAAAASSTQSAEKKSATAGATPGQPGLTKKKSAGAVPGASPSPTPNRGQGTATPTPTNHAPGTLAPSASVTGASAAGAKKAATGQKKASIPGAAPAGTPPAAGAPSSAAPGTKKSATEIGNPANGGTTATKKKGTPKPKAVATPAGGEPTATPVETPEPKKPEPESQPTPPPAEETSR